MQLSFTCKPPQADVVAEVLADAGALAVSMADASDQPVYEPEMGATPLWAHTRVTGLFPVETRADHLVTRLRERLAPAEVPTPVVETVEERDWSNACRDHFRACCFGDRLWVVPSWEPPPERTPAQEMLVMDPGLAFGTGGHATTAMCLTWLAGESLEGAEVVDYGCGSGILAVAAVKLGARRAWAVDRDPQALSATRENASRNGVATSVQALPASELPALAADLVIANILANTLMEAAETLSKLLRFRGRLALAGILRTQASDVARAYAPWCDLRVTLSRDEWVLLAGTRAPSKRERECPM